MIIIFLINNQPLILLTFTTNTKEWEGEKNKLKNVQICSLPCSSAQQYSLARQVSLKILMTCVPRHPLIECLVILIPGWVTPSTAPTTELDSWVNLLGHNSHAYSYFYKTSLTPESTRIPSCELIIEGYRVTH